MTAPPIIASDLGPPTTTSTTLDAATRNRVIGQVITLLRAQYVFPDRVPIIEQALTRDQQAGKYLAPTTDHGFADAVSETLHDASHDLHLRLEFLPVLPNSSTAAAATERSNAQNAQHYGLTAVEHLAGNIGRLEVTGFFSPDLADPVVDQALQALADTDALIVDLRSVGGGDTLTVYHLASYFFGDQAVHLMDIHYPNSDGTLGRTDADKPPPGFRPSAVEAGSWEVWTQAVSGPHYVDKPVYLLTSHQTASASEALAFILQAQHRATVVGESTAGAAHFTLPQRLNEQFVLDLPFASTTSPATGTDWEGAGVQPDISVEAATAQDTAYHLALASTSGSRLISTLP